MLRILPSKISNFHGFSRWKKNGFSTIYREKTNFLLLQRAEGLSLGVYELEKSRIVFVLAKNEFTGVFSTLRYAQ